jgi:hypothetical protein
MKFYFSSIVVSGSMAELVVILCQRELEALLENQDTVPEEPCHGKGRSSIR